MPFSKVNPGDPLRLRAEDWNDALDAAASFKTAGQTGARPSPAKLTDQPEIPVRNRTAAAMERFTLAVLVSPLTSPPTSNTFSGAVLPSIDPAMPVSATSGPSGQVATVGTLWEFLANRTLQVEPPTSANSTGQLVVLAEPLQVSGIGMAYTAGIVPLRVSLASISDTHIDRAVSGTALGIGGATGFPLVWVSGGVGHAAVTGEQWGIVRLSPDPMERFVRVVPVSNAAGAGKYIGKLAGPPVSSVDPDTDLTVADLGAAGPFPDVLLMSRAEIGVSAGHDLKIGTPYLSYKVLGQDTHGRDLYQTDAIELGCSA